MFNSPEGSLEEIFVNDYDMIDQYAKTGSAWLWGDNLYGQLGDGTRTNRSSPVQTVAGGTNWKTVEVNEWNAVGIKTDGTLWTWGYENQLGDNTNARKSSPVQTVAGGTNWKTVGRPSYHPSAIKTDGTLWLWGNNGEGELGDGTNSDPKSSPVQTVAGGTNWKQVESSYYSTVAIKTDGTLWLWGKNSNGELGDNTIVSKSSPIQTIAGGTNWKQVSMGGSTQSTAAIKIDGTLWTWGDNQYGQLGNNTRDKKSSPIQTIAGGTNWKQVSSGGTHMSAIKTDGTLWTWGWNRMGALGDGTPGDSYFLDTVNSKSSPVQTVSGGTNWKQVSAGDSHNSAAIKTDGSLWLWGYSGNGWGQLGNNDSTTNKSSPIQTIAGGTNWKQVSVGGNIVAATYFYDAGNLYPGGGNSGGAFSTSISTNQQELNLRNWALANGWDGSGAATITIGSGVYIWSDSNTTAALTISGSWPGGITVINNGYIMGKGGSGTPGTSGAGSGGPAISLGINATITNNSYIAGGGGAGQAGYSYISSTFGYANVGGGGGAGGGAGGGGWYSGGSLGFVATGSGGAGGPLTGGMMGTDGTNNGAGAGGGGGYWGGGGGSIYNGTGGSYFLGGGGGGGRELGGWSGGGIGGNSSNYTGSGTFQVSGDGGGLGAGPQAGGNYLGARGAGGGGGYGAAGGTGAGTGPYGGGGAGGKAINLNGYTATYTDNGTTYGSVS